MELGEDAEKYAALQLESNAPTNKEGTPQIVAIQKFQRSW
jgi:hypothetical protein